MDFFDERILAALKDGKPKSFTTLLREVGFSHNTLQQHLEDLAAQGFVVKEKVTSNSLGRPRFAYHASSRAIKQVTAALQEPHVKLVALSFSRLRYVCRFEKGGYCEGAKKSCKPQNCPQIRK